MNSSRSPQPFDQQHAATYDEHWAPLAPLRDSLHLQIRLILHDLPADARILCVGVGTGAELLALARFFPGWRFVAIDPSEPMLDFCRKRAADAGISDRCEFHPTTLDAVLDSTRFHASTSLLVSQFITDRSRRIAFFQEIAHRLLPGGFLITADLAIAASDQHQSLVGVWGQMMSQVGSTPEKIQATLASYGREVAVVPTSEVETLLLEAGFLMPVHFSQSLLIHAWYARTDERRC